MRSLHALVSALVLAAVLLLPALALESTYTALGGDQTEATNPNGPSVDVVSLRASAEKGDAQAQWHLGTVYQKGEGVGQDSAEAAKWYRMAAEQGHLEAQHDLGLLYCHGTGVPQDYREAFKWFLKAAARGETRSQFNLGVAYHSGQGVSRKPSEAVRWYRMAADHGLTRAQCALGYLYAKGDDNVDQDYEEAAQWYRKAAEQGDAEAQCALGLMYMNDEGVDEDYMEAVNWFRRAAEQGHAGALYNLGLAYANGYGVPCSPLAAGDWFFKAGETYLRNGNRDLALACCDQILAVGAPKALMEKLLADIYGAGAAAASAGTAVDGSQREEPQIAFRTGTGWPVAGGFVVTCQHVIAGAKRIAILTPGGARIQATVAAADPANDLALLAVDNAAPLPPALPLAVESPEVGEQVFTVGYPHPDFMGVGAKLTEGIVNAKSGIAGDIRVLQISAQVQSGNSGGPLLNMNGEIVGIVVAKLDAAVVFSWTGDLPENVGYAVKVAYLRPLLDSISGTPRAETLPNIAATLTDLAGRVTPSALLVVVEGGE